MLAKGAPPYSPPLPRPKFQSNGKCFFSFFFNRATTKRLSFLTIGAALQPPTADATLDHQPDDASSTGSRRLARNFDKLKTQKLKSIVKQASLAKKSLMDHVDEATADKTFLKKNNSGRANHGIINRRDTYQREVFSSRSRDSAPNSSASRSRGWGDGGSVDRYRPASRSADRSESRHNFSTDSNFFSRKSFKDMGCSELMISCLKEQRFLRPSHIQVMAFAPVIERKTCVIADQSGSGKTLAYLIPVIQRLRQEELQGLGETKANSPRVLIIVPTAELGSQVLNICRSMSKCGLPFRSMIVTGGHRQKTQLENLAYGVDVLIATPGRFLFLIKEGFLQLTNLECAVLDEVDILFNDEDFELAQQSLINASRVNMQYLFVTATLPVDIYNKLVEVFPDCKVIMGPGIHRTSTGLEEFLVDCSGAEEAGKTPDTAFANKKSSLMQLVEQRPVPKTIVFCNKIETCRQLENLLKRFDRKETRVRVIPFHAALEQKKRVANMKEFMSSETKEGGSLFLVCTDRASRGIDFNGVDHVVLFDFPRDPSEYVRRVGRTARGAGGKGKAFIFVVWKQVSLARRIIERNQKGHPLHEVPCAYELMG